MPPRKRKAPETLEDAVYEAPDPALYEQALHELGINVPVYACRLVNNRLEFRLYGGRVVFWPPVQETARREHTGR